MSSASRFASQSTLAGRALAAALGAIVLAGCAGVSGGAPPAGLRTAQSPHGAAATLDRLEAAAKARGFAIVARVDHAAGAQRVGRSLRPTQLLVFGNPQGGTPLMECAQASGVDLPLKALAWTDAEGRTWLGVNDPAWLGERHGITAACAAPLAAMRGALDALVAEATRP